MNIGVIQFHDSTFREVAELSEYTVKTWSYCHGYVYLPHQIEDHAGRHPCWTKIRLICEYLYRFDWLFYVDSDAIITDYAQALEVYIKAMETQGQVIGICDDCNGPNAGVLLIKNCLATRDLFDLVRWQGYPDQLPHTDQLSEQKALLYWMGQVLKPEQVARFAQRVFNSYLYDLYNGRYHYPQGEWCDGDLVLHLPGVDNATRVRVFKEFIKELDL